MHYWSLFRACSLLKTQSISFQQISFMVLVILYLLYIMSNLPTFSRLHTHSQGGSWILFLFCQCQVAAELLHYLWSSPQIVIGSDSVFFGPNHSSLPVKFSWKGYQVIPTFICTSHICRPPLNWFSWTLPPEESIHYKGCEKCNAFLGFTKMTYINMYKAHSCSFCDREMF